MSEWPLSVRAKFAYSAWRRKQTKKKYASVFQEASAVLLRHDPIGISSEDNTDEYDPEIGTILPRMSRCHSAEDVRAVVFEEFQRWFSEEIAGDEMKYDAISKELWDLWLRSLATKAGPTMETGP